MFFTNTILKFGQIYFAINHIRSHEYKERERDALRQRQRWETKRDREAEKWNKENTVDENNFSPTLGHTPECIDSVWFIQIPLFH